MTGEPFEVRVAAVLHERESHIPAELRLPEPLLRSLPANVTQVPHTCGLLTEHELDITDRYDACGLRDAIARRELSCVEVASAFGKRALIAHQVTNCLVDWFLPEALERARWLDERMAETGRPVGPLHGVPVSFKDHIPIKGHAVSAGFLSTRAIASANALVVEKLLEAGAVVYVKTHMPQAVMHMECESYLGATCNPYNTALSSGGTTGGEAALIAMGGSVLGVGSDIGGSIRSPAGSCGIAGFKPTPRLLSLLGTLAPTPGNNSLVNAIGPLGRSVRDCELLVETLMHSDQAQRDISLVPLGWAVPRIELNAARPLRIGVITHDGVMQPDGVVQQVMHFAQERLRHVPGIELVPYTPLDAHKAAEMASSLRAPDGGSMIREMCAKTGEPLTEVMAWRLSLDTVKQRSIRELWEMQAELATYRQAFYDHWRSLGLDCALGPFSVVPAAAHRSTTYFFAYTCLWNVHDFPALVLPTALTASACTDAGTYSELPMCVQLAARSFDDARLFGLAAALEPMLARR